MIPTFCVEMPLSRVASGWFFWREKGEVCGLSVWCSEGLKAEGIGTGGEYDAGHSLGSRRGMWWKVRLRDAPYGTEADRSPLANQAFGANGGVVLPELRRSSRDDYWKKAVG